jgi:DNA-binding MarR family transcriptional regulator
MPFAPASTESTITARFPSEQSWMMWGSFLQAYKAVVERIDGELKDKGALSLAQFEMILRVRDVGGRIRFVDLATIMMVSPSRISRQIDALHSRGYLLREATNKDRRATFAVLTASGERAYQKALGLFLQAFERHFLSHVPKRFAKPFVACLMALIDDSDSLDKAAILVDSTRKRNGLSVKQATHRPEL